jgi:hypothetical protein
MIKSIFDDQTDVGSIGRPEENPNRKQPPNEKPTLPRVLAARCLDSQCHRDLAIRAAPGTPWRRNRRNFTGSDTRPGFAAAPASSGRFAGPSRASTHTGTNW